MFATTCLFQASLARTELPVLCCAEALFHRCSDSVTAREIQQAAFLTGYAGDADEGGLVLGNISLQNGSLGMGRGGGCVVMLPEGRGTGRSEDRRQEVRGVLQRKEVHQRQNFCFSSLPTALMVEALCGR